MIKKITWPYNLTINNIYNNNNNLTIEKEIEKNMNHLKIKIKTGKLFFF